MPVQPTYPGVYVQEAPSGVHAISGVSTSVAAFVGMCPTGPVNVPTRVFSFREYDTQFGGTALVGEMSDQVRQFFMNGGGTAWIVRNALGALNGDSLVARSTLLAEDGTAVLTLSARNAGVVGNEIRIEVDYATTSPERTFNLIVYREQTQVNGSVVQIEREVLPDLSLDPLAPRNAAKIVNEQSTLLTATVPAGLTTSGVHISQSGLIFDATAPGGIKAFFDTHMVAPTRLIAISVAGAAPVIVNLGGIAAADSTLVCNAIRDAINAELAVGTSVTVTRRAAAGGEVLQITSTNGPVSITSAPVDDAAAQMRLGVGNGGLESDGWASRRPAANGICTRVHTGTNPADAFARVHTFAATSGNDLTDWSVAGTTVTHTATLAVPFGAGPALGLDGTTGLTGVIGNFAAVAAALDVLVGSIETTSAGDFDVYRSGMRIGIRPTYGNRDADLSLTLTSTPTYNFAGGSNLATTGQRPTNVVRYALGSTTPAIPAAPAGGYRTFVQTGSNGLAPLPADYDFSFDKLERTADIFNLLILPRALNQLDTARAAVWGPASAFCQRRRAFLLVDPPVDSSNAFPWTSANVASAHAVDLRSGVVQDHAAVYWPRIVSNDAKGNKITIDPSGTMAGVYAKTDVKRGIWKAPAGLEASLIGVRGLEVLVTNDENGVTNPQAINTLRTLASGATSWGARTMIGYEGAPDQDYRYVPVRRTALFIEESLYRGLQFAVFEPNGEVLWGQIRLAVGAFMNGLFRQGAFKGLKASDAYFVECGPSTTTQTDINLGIVNVEVGFAPLKPTEFVVLTIRQMVGQIEV